MTNLPQSPSRSFGGVSQKIRHRLLGLSMVLVIVLLLALTVALFNKALTPVVRVRVDAERAGLQLLPRSDVKVRGLIVGEVRDTHATADGAFLDLALEPDKARLIPRNVQARLLPKTLFGEKYVDLQIPARPGPVGLRAGQVIQQDRSQAAVEIDQVLDNLLPLLEAVPPAKLNATLNALATALQGRGDQVGQMLVDADDYLKRLNPHLPTVVHDLRQLAIVSDNLNGAAPDLISIMQNLQTTNKTIVDKEPQLVEALDKGIGLTGDVTDFTAANEPRLEGAMIANRKALALLAKYSPSVPCVFQGMAKLTPRLVDAMGGRQPGVHVTLELVKPRPGYKPGLDRPEFKDYRNPRCYGLPNPKVPFPQYQVLDGTEDDQWWAGGAGRSLSSVLVKPGASTDDDSLLKGLMGPAMGTGAGQVSDLATLLYRPAASGMVVTVK